MVISKEPVSLCTAWRWLVVLRKYMACSAHCRWNIPMYESGSNAETLDAGTLRWRQQNLEIMSALPPRLIPLDLPMFLSRRCLLEHQM